MVTQTYRTDLVEEIDGSRILYEFLECNDEILLPLMQDLFEMHWSKIVFGPCIQGAVYEIRATQPPKKLSMLDGYLTVDFGEWHFHLCIGEHRGTKANPTPEPLARVRRVSKAAFFRSVGNSCAGGSWGLRLWNGAGEQMLTVFFPNPYLSDRFKPQKPNWSRLSLWNELRVKYLPGAVAWAPSEKEYPESLAAH
jgi:hypothetical protein